MIPIVGTYATQGVPFRLSRTPSEIKGPAPTIGQHNNDLTAIAARLHENGRVAAHATPAAEIAICLLRAFGSLI